MDSLVTDIVNKSIVSYLASIHLMPYLCDITRKASLAQDSCLFSMKEQFPDDIICQTLESQYMIGRNLLVIPVHQEETVMEFYLPKGIWTNYLTGELSTGGKWCSEYIHSLHPILMVRENSILPTSIYETPGYPAVQFRVYAIQDSIRIADSFYDQRSAITWPYSIRRIHHKITISSDSNMLYSFRIMNETGLEADHGFLIEENSDTIVQPDSNAAILTMILSN